MQLMFSRKIVDLDYDAENRVLRIKFNDGISRRYYDVPPKIYEDLKNSSDRNKYYHNVVDGHFRIDGKLKGA
ncbi:MAG: KTSC domain-containing protein [Burkholderiales bacterium]|jgi:hypothetical protein